MHPSVDLHALKRGWYCEERGSNVVSFDDLPALAGETPWGTGLSTLDLSRLPSVAAIPLTELPQVAQLWRVCDYAEFLLRLCVSSGVAEVDGAGKWRLLERVASAATSLVVCGRAE